MEIDTPLRLGTSLLAMLVLPFWLGTAGSSAMALAAFCLLAALALAIVVDWPEVTNGRMSPAALLDDVALYTLSIAVPAGLSFATARQFA
jgi:hypothetical protein